MIPRQFLIPDNKNPASLIDHLRRAIYSYLREHPENSKIDLDDVRKRIPEVSKESETGGIGVPDYMLRRHLLFCKRPLDLDSAMEHFITTFRFRSSYSLSKLTFANTIYEEHFHLLSRSDMITDTTTDRSGNKLVIGRLKYYRKLPQTDRLLQRVALFLTEQYDLQLESGQLFPQQGLTLIADLSDFNYLRDVNLDMIFFGSQLHSAYGGLATKAIGYELHWAFSALYRLLHATLARLLGRRELNLHLATAETIDEHVTSDQRPSFLGGGTFEKKKVVVVKSTGSSSRSSSASSSLTFESSERNLKNSNALREDFAFASFRDDVRPLREMMQQLRESGVDEALVIEEKNVQKILEYYQAVLASI